MKINCVEIQDFRKLKSTRIDFADETTLFVGANNSGKTSAMVALRYFLVEHNKFTMRDLTLSNWSRINAIGAAWESNPEDHDPNLVDWGALLPSMDVWLDVSESEVHHVVHLLPTLDWGGGRLGVRLQFEPRDIVALKKDFVAARKAAEETLAAAKSGKDGKTHSLELWPVRLDEDVVPAVLARARGAGECKKVSAAGGDPDPARRRAFFFSSSIPTARRASLGRWRRYLAVRAPRPATGARRGQSISPGPLRRRLLLEGLRREAP